MRSYKRQASREKHKDANTFPLVAAATCSSNKMHAKESFDEEACECKEI
ncbi:MAG TPA: hypothetical protein VK498_15240 [Ferruginibacter sp.]|nr:hypothetical protein [Ferruginibacter sp.]